MSKAMKRKKVFRDLNNECLVKEQQEIVKIVLLHGRGLLEVQNAAGDKFMASLPSKFRNSYWFKKGDFVVVEPIEEGQKVKAEVVHFLSIPQIKELKQEGVWPSAFDSAQTDGKKKYEDEDGLFVNRNKMEDSDDDSSVDHSDGDCSESDSEDNSTDD